jgi:hypothetical protein
MATTDADTDTNFDPAVHCPPDCEADHLFIAQQFRENFNASEGSKTDSALFHVMCAVLHIQRSHRKVQAWIDEQQKGEKLLVDGLREISASMKRSRELLNG